METTVTKESMEALIDSIAYHHEDNKATICFIKLKSGFIIIGTSGVVDKSTFDSKIGEHFAYQNAFNKLWEFEGYRLQWKLHDRQNDTPEARYLRIQMECANG